MKRLRSITIVEDRTPTARCDRGFLTLRRLRLRNEYADGGSSDEYDCDLVSRKAADAVVAVVFERDGRRSIRVLLRTAVRAPVYLRQLKTFVHPDPRVYDSLDELVAGLVEPDDPPGPAGLRRRAAVEAHEEAGLDIAPDGIAVLGGETFASPGIGDEKLFFCAAEARLDSASPGAGDGSVMEQGAAIRLMDLGDAIAACRTGEIPDMKTEVGLLRLAEHVGYVPQLGCFVEELPDELRDRYRSLGIDRAGTPVAEAGTDR